MAKYTYECLDDMHTLEVEHEMLAEPIVECPECGQAMIKLPPQRVTVAYSPWDVLYRKKEREYAEYRGRKKKEKQT